MNTNHLYKEYARVINMCEGTALEDETCKCVRWKWKNSDQWFYFDCHGHPNLNKFNVNQDVDFAVAVLEGRPVFVGDTIYYKCDGEKAKAIAVDDDIIIVKDSRGECVFHPDDFTWTPPAPELPAPKRTFTLNGAELPCPKPKFKEGTDWTFDISGYLFGFGTKEECDSVYQAIIKLLTEARDKP